MVPQVLFDRACAELKQAVAENKRLAEENEWLTSKLLQAGCVVQHDGSFFLEDVPKMLAREFDLLKQENKRLRQVCAEAARKISEDVRDDGPCGREALTDVYIMLDEAANGGEGFKR